MSQAFFKPRGSSEYKDVVLPIWGFPLKDKTVSWQSLFLLSWKSPYLERLSLYWDGVQVSTAQYYNWAHFLSMVGQSLSQWEKTQHTQQLVSLAKTSLSNRCIENSPWWCIASFASARQHYNIIALIPRKYSRAGCDFSRNGGEYSWEMRMISSTYTMDMEDNQKTTL